MNNDLVKVIPWETNCIDDSKGAPWTELESEDFHVAIYKDMYPVTDGHLLFVPKYNTIAVLNEAMKNAVMYGAQKVMDGSWDGYNVGINVGEAAGQTCTWPHVHLIPRRKGDMEDPRGGVRHVIPEKGNYKLWK
jgi:diadenosine tetraphosphate (Ap4A) HIT family hydrolase